MARPGAEKTALTSAYAPASRKMSRRAKDMSFAARYMPKQTPLFPHAAAI